MTDEELYVKNTFEIYQGSDYDYLLISKRQNGILRYRCLPSFSTGGHNLTDWLTIEDAIEWYSSKMQGIEIRVYDLYAKLEDALIRTYIL